VHSAYKITGTVSSFIPVHTKLQMLQVDTGQKLCIVITSPTRNVTFLVISIETQDSTIYHS